MALKIEALDKRIQILKNEIVPDGQGGYTKLQSNVIDTVWAEILKPRFWSGDSGKGPTTAITQGIRIRPNCNVGLECLIKYKDTTYEILDIEYQDDCYILTTQATKKRW